MESTTEFQHRLAELPATDLEIAAKLGVWPQTVRNWRTGRKQPSTLSRKALTASYPELERKLSSVG